MQFFFDNNHDVMIIQKKIEIPIVRMYLNKNFSKLVYFKKLN